MRKVVILSFLASLLLGACGEDDYVYPNVLTDMIDLKTDHTGTGRYLITDEGTEWRIQSRTGLDGLAPDTTYRTVTMYAPLTDSEEAEKEAMLYNTQLVISPVPLPESKFKGDKDRSGGHSKHLAGWELPEPDFTSQSQRSEARLSLY